jgi:N-acetylglucosaminyl-diphospho-decaprenol L-rhamnosyltransferase
VYPSARHLPSLIRGGMHAVVGPFWKSNPWSAAYRQERLEPTERPVGWLSGSCLLVRRSAFGQIGGFDERYFMYMEDVDLGDRLGKAGWLSVYVPSAEVLHHKGHSTGGDPANHLAAHHKSTYLFLADRHSGWLRAPLRWTLRASLAVRSRLMVRSALRAAGRQKLLEGRH